MSHDYEPVVLFGGAFDPFHAGHALIVAAAGQLPAKRLLVVPNGSPPHRRPQASWLHRLEMARLGTEGFAQVSELEPPGATRWTVDTVARLHERGMHPILAVGSDSFAALDSWKQWRELLATVSWAVVPRDGCANWLPTDSAARAEAHSRITDDAQMLAEPGRIWKWPLPVPAVSSTTLRTMIASGQAGWEKMLPGKVAAYVAAKSLYHSAPAAAPAGPGRCADETAAVCAALTDGKASEVLALDTRKSSGNMFDSMVICTANSVRHAEALAHRACEALKKPGAKAPVREGPGEPCWILLDAGAVVVQIMNKEAREHFRLEDLWQTPEQ